MRSKKALYVIMAVGVLVLDVRQGTAKTLTPDEIKEQLRIAGEVWQDEKAINRVLSNIYGRNALHYAAIRNDIMELKRLFLADRSKEINAPDRSGATPLVLAVKEGNIGAATLLMEKGANPHIRDNEGNSAADYAKEQKHKEMIDILLHGYRPRE